MICVLDVTSGPARGRRFWLRTHQQVEIGRISSADFAIPADPHMSRRHLILEGTVSAFRVRDVGSANGTYVNNAKITSVELCSGDRIRAGETTFEVSVLDDDQNPHGKDGVTFSGLLSPTAGAAPIAAQAGASVATSPPVAAHPPAMSDHISGDSELTQRSPALYRPGTGIPPTRRWSNPGTVLSTNTWWAEFDFVVSDVPCLLDESGKRNSQFPLLSEMLQRLEPEFALTAVINTEYLGRFGKQHLGTLVEQRMVTWHSPSVCSILDDRSRDFVRMIECTISQDALILIGAQSKLEAGWLERLVQQVTRPSELNRVLRQDSSDLIDYLLSTAEFVLFEQDRQGRLSLLVRP